MLDKLLCLPAEQLVKVRQVTVAVLAIVGSTSQGVGEGGSCSAGGMVLKCSSEIPSSWNTVDSLSEWKMFPPLNTFPPLAWNAHPPSDWHSNNFDDNTW